MQHSFWRGAWNLSTTVTARTDGASQNGLVTVGNLDSYATASETVNTVLKGVNIDLTGDAAVKAVTNAVASGIGSMPGGWKMVGVGISNVHADIGRDGDSHTAKIIVTDGVQLKAAHIDLTAYNEGNSTVDFIAGMTKAVVSVQKAKQPTRNWYDTGILLDGGTVLESTAAGSAEQPDLRLRSETLVRSTSLSESSAIGILYNANSTYGEVHATEENNIDIGSGAMLTAKGALAAEALNHDRINVGTRISEGMGLIAGSKAYSFAEVDRTAQVNVGDGAKLTAGDALKLRAITGDRELVEMSAYAKAGGGFAVSTADVKYKGTANAVVNIGKRVEITAEKDVELKATATSRQYEDRNEPGIVVNSRAIGSSLRMKPNAQGTVQTNFNASVNINSITSGSQSYADRTTVKSNNGSINVTADNEGLRSDMVVASKGYSGYGTAKADTNVISNLHNLVWVDNASLTARNKISLLARNGGVTSYNYADSTNESVVGSVKGRNYFEGSNWNQVRSSNTSKVSFAANKVVHEAAAPWGDDDNFNKIHEHHVHSPKGSPVSETSKHYWNWDEYWRCDFCGKSGKKDGDAAEMSMAAVTLSSRNQENASQATQKRALQAALEKALSPLTDIQRMANSVGYITRGRYGEEDYAAASKIFALDMAALLEKDATLDNNQINRYRLWNNTDTYLDVYLLPNATRQYATRRGGKLLLQYVAEVVRGDIRGDGEKHEIDIITALTDKAIRNPVMPVGSAGSLDFSTGVLTLPSRAYFELYLHEISAGWLVDSLNSGFLQAMMADQDAVNDCALNGADLPEGTPAIGLIDGGAADGWQRLWIGASPETAADPDQTLICLMINAETDEVDAFRTTVNRIENGEAPVDVSLYLYRDSNADRMEQEKYDVMFFDTPEYEKSLVKVVTDVVTGRNIDTPLAMRIVLRGCYIKGADLPVYSISDHYFAMCDGTDGKVSLFNGLYQNTFDGDTFESDYIRIEGMVDGDLNVTIKRGQRIWFEWIDENSLTNIQGDNCIRVGEDWYPEGEQPEASDRPENAAAA
ncbi:MAG: hypothetical protein IKO07_14170 [Clostridia bacterium]|nr:hypothetical protein [Clostridia bacterium]